MHASDASIEARDALREKLPALRHLRFVGAPPAAEVIPAHPVDFLRALGGPVAFWIPGRDPRRTRAVTTLLHGNEPSGLRAIHAFLRDARTPEANLLCAIISVEVALAPPFFSHRMRVGCRDLNRCFPPPVTEREGELAAELLVLLRAAQPEALVDLHNTSGTGPAYSVCTMEDPRRAALTSFFSNHMIVTDIRLGTLVEALEKDFPCVTIEVGGARDQAADRIAEEGLIRYAAAESVLERSEEAAAVIPLRHPIRVELEEGARLAYAAARVQGADVTLWPDVDKHNFEILPAGSILGWCGPKGLDALRILDTAGTCHARRFFDAEAGKLVAKGPLRLFMVTTNPVIAQDDCLFYALPLDD